MEIPIPGKMVFILRQDPGSRFNIKMLSHQYRKSHCGDKTVLRLSYLHKGISYTGKKTSLYWIRAQISSLPISLQSYMQYRVCSTEPTYNGIWLFCVWGHQYSLTNASGDYLKGIKKSWHLLFCLEVTNTNLIIANLHAMGHATW